MITFPSSLPSWFAMPRKTLQHQVFQQSGGILSGGFLSAELAANSEHLDELLRCRRRRLRWTRRHDADERGDHSGVERIVLGQNSARLGELPQLERIDLAHGHAGCLQRSHGTTLVAAASLDADRCDREAAQLLHQYRPARLGRSAPKRSTRRATPSRPDDPSTRRFRKTRASSYPFLANAGSRPRNCSGMEEATGAPSSFAV